MGHIFEGVGVGVGRGFRENEVEFDGLRRDVKYLVDNNGK